MLAATDLDIERAQAHQTKLRSEVCMSFLEALMAKLTKLRSIKTDQPSSRHSASKSTAPSWGEGTFAELSESDVDKLLNDRH
jgi:hypothetical protein